MKDLFIAHASEDKDDLVRPLAEKLIRAGVDVWYDEFSMSPGDSVSESIDKGLIECNYGLVVISPAFLKKKWTDYELKSLLAKEVHKGKTIIPVWHNVDYEAVSGRSLYLADKNALKSSSGIDQLSFDVIKAVRPDIINSYALKSISRKLKPRGKRVKRSISELDPGEIVHKAMPKYVVLASKMFDSAFPGISTLKEIVENFARDHDYDNEFLLWCIITSAYWDTVYAIGQLPAKEQMHEMLHALLGLSAGETSWLEDAHLSEEEKLCLGNAYVRNAQILFPLSKSMTPTVAATVSMASEPEEGVSSHSEGNGTTNSSQAG